MHIEPGILNAAKVMSKNIGAVGALAAYTPSLVRRPPEIGKVLLAAVFFSLFMQVFHMPVGASELPLGRSLGRVFHLRLPADPVRLHAPACCFKG